MAAAKALPLSDLIKAVSKEPERRTIMFNGVEYEFYSTHLTLAQREKVKNSQRNQDDASEFALRLLIDKALTKDGKKMFQPGQYAELKNEWPASELEQAMLQMIKQEQPELSDEDDEPKN